MMPSTKKGELMTTADRFAEIAETQSADYALAFLADSQCELIYLCWMRDYRLYGYARANELAKMYNRDF